MSNRNPPHYTDGITGPPSIHMGILVACRLAHQYQRRLPTVEQLRADFGMSRATAYRWLAAMRLVREEAAATASNREVPGQ